MLQHRTEPEQPFGPKNPPPSMDAALARLRQLEVFATSIQNQLNTTTPSEFADVEKFRTWKKRASSALAHKHAETRYLERWAGIREGESARGQGEASTQDARAALERITVGIRDTVNKVELEYQPLYSASNQPPTVEEGRARWKLLSDLRADVDDFLTEVNRYGKNAGVREGAMTTAKRPLQLLNETLKAELTFLNKYLQERSGNWLFFLVGLVERAVQNGLELSAEEQATWGDILHFRETKLKRNA